MSEDELKAILERHELWLDRKGGKRANLQGANLQYADLRSADLQYASLQYADMRGANLQYADLQYADLEGAGLQYAVLQYADMRGANLQYADLQYADLEGADLRGANLDYSCFPLWCGSKGMIVDRRIAAQIAAHFCALDCDDADYQTAREAILEFARTSHRAMDLGLSGEIVKECNDVATPIDVALRKRIAELEGKIDQLTAHSDIERQEMSVSEHANYLLNEYGRLQFDYAFLCKPDGESFRNEARNNLEEYIAELEAAQRWIPVSERLPEDGEPVLAAYVDTMLTAAYYRHHIAFGGVDNWWDVEGCHTGNPTHWMPLPEPPEVQDV